ncbi:MAG: DHH family phosphoesterase [Methanomicrobiales archaeon]|nr:DHH family phosphoesterase [Methanomicrobiales archaeon]
MGLDHDLREAADQIRDAEMVTIISHIDADGITSATILHLALQREGIPVIPVFVRQLEPFAMRFVPQDESLKIFSDLGAGQQNLLVERGLKPDRVLIVDHHVSQPCGDGYPQVNALEYGFLKFSAAGMAYLLAREIDRDNTDLAALGVIGNVGDMMAREDLKLIGPARGIIEDGVSRGVVEVLGKELNCYGISTRPIHISLAFSDDPFIPGITNNPDSALRFLEKLGIDMKSDGNWRVWEDLTREEKRTITSGVMQQLLAHGCSTRRLISEVYLFPHEMEHTPLRNAAEYATLLNACGRWAKPAIGHAVCLGDRGGAYREAEHMLVRHRTVIRELLQFILENGVIELSHLQYLHVGERFPDTIVGIGAGMALSKLNRVKPILIMCKLPEDPTVTKVSMRTVDEMVNRGIDLQAALVHASRACGGEAGGHRIAAGAYIPGTAEQEFVHCVNRILSEQCPAESPHHC